MVVGNGICEEQSNHEPADGNGQRSWADVVSMDTRGRSRIAVHDVPENENAEALSDYGIEKHMLPTEMGGSFEFNPSEWIANRRAAEMEEL